MSWGFKFAGRAADVARRVKETQNATYCPQALIDAVEQVAKRVPDGRILVVDSTGHMEVRTKEPAPQWRNDFTPEQLAEYQATCQRLNAEGDIVYGGGQRLNAEGDIVYGGGTLTFSVMQDAGAKD